MTRKHFEAIAAALHATQPGTPGQELIGTDRAIFVQWQADLYAMADICASANPNFDRTRFLHAAYHGNSKGTN